MSFYHSLLHSFTKLDFFVSVTNGDPGPIVRELVGRVRNVVLMNVYLDLENPGGVRILGRGYMNQGREWGS